MVFEKVKVILAEQFDVEEDTITMDTNLEEDLSADSLDVVDLLMSIEDEFEIEPKQNLSSMTPPSYSTFIRIPWISLISFAAS